MALLKAPSRAVPVALLLLAGALVAAPLGLGFSTGITKDNAPPGDDFAKFGCTACHGEHLVFAAVDNSAVSVKAVAADGVALNGPYVAHAVYTLTITLAESNNPTAANHAGFNLRASSGKLSGVDGQSQASGDGAQATHLGAGRTSWNVTWEAPEAGAAGFSLFVNDVDGDQVNSAGDVVRWVQFGFADKDGAVLGAVEEHAVHFGITLQQYWIGLIALVGMIFVMVAGFVYLKFVNPHNTDQKDR
ncbi:MAG: choice-of-anchor V domain-containing protein [Candidatus Thermoplasmatota archaeon]